MSKLLITGGAGFTGVNFARHYLKQGHEVVILDNLSRSGSLANLNWLLGGPGADHLTVIIGDVRHPPAELEREVRDCDAVFHFAAEVAVTTSVEDPRRDFMVNALGTFNILELVRSSCGEKPALFYASTNKVYGRMEDVAVEEGERRYRFRDFPKGIPEDRPLDLHSPYGCSKGAADQYVRDYGRIYGLKTAVFRQSCIYGLRQFGIEDQGWVAWFVIAGVLGKPLTIYGDGKQVRDVLFVDDLIAVYDAALHRIDSGSGGIYNIGGGPGNALSLVDLVEFLDDECGLDLQVRYDDWRPGDQRVYVSSIEKAERELGWVPRVDWREGVGRLVTWAENNRELVARFV